MFAPNASIDSKVSENENAVDVIEEGIILDHTNSFDAMCGPGYRGSREFKFIHGKDYWHKVTVLQGATGNKEDILKRIMDFVYPADLLPVMCRDDGVHLYFLIRRCGKAIEKLCRVRMKIETPLDPIHLRIVLGFANVKDIPLNMQMCLTKAITKRYNHTRKYLDLSNFHNDPELVDVLFCPLSQHKMLHCVFNLAVNYHLNIKNLNLANNGISFVRNLGSSTPFKQINKIDLRQNSISSAAELVHLRQSLIRELLLDLNPMCEKYSCEKEYINDVRNAIPTLVKLDGVTLPAPGFPRTIKNFVLLQDDILLADQFIRQYFTLYDSEHRKKLEGLYYKEALFSLSATYLPAQSTSNTARLTEYTIESRNLLKLSDYSKNLRVLHRGPESIMGTICKLPTTEHDRYSFRVDVTKCNSGVVISVKGVFKEPTILKAPLIRSFYRVFVLKEINPKCFQIANESLHISNATTKEAETAFKVTKPVITRKMLASKTGNLSENEKTQMTDTMSMLTTMNKKWSNKCLEETQWEIKEALIVFTELYKMNKIPQEAFSGN